MKHYQVKFQFNGQLKYGIVTYYKAPKGFVIVEDAVLPVSYKVREADLIDIDMKFGHYDFKAQEYVDCDEYQAYVQQQFKQAMALAEQTVGVQPGAMFAIGVGDGAAHYVVTKVRNKKVTVEWRGFELDRYYDHFFGSGRTIDRRDVERYIVIKKPKLAKKK